MKDDPAIAQNGRSSRANGGQKKGTPGKEEKKKKSSTRRNAEPVIHPTEKRAERETKRRRDAQKTTWQKRIPVGKDGRDDAGEWSGIVQKRKSNAKMRGSTGKNQKSKGTQLRREVKK